MVLSPTKGKYCLGYCLRDKGQSLVPEPPERITGIMLDNIKFIVLIMRRLYNSYRTVNVNSAKNSCVFLTIKCKTRKILKFLLNSS